MSPAYNPTALSNDELQREVRAHEEAAEQAAVTLAAANVRLGLLRHELMERERVSGHKAIRYAFGARESDR